MLLEECFHAAEVVPVVRTQVQLTDEQVAALRALAVRRGVSLAELIRQAVDRLLAESEDAERWRRAAALIGRYHDPAADVSTRHDQYLEAAYH